MLDERAALVVFRPRWGPGCRLVAAAAAASASWRRGRGGSHLVGSRRRSRSSEGRLGGRGGHLGL